MQRQIKEPEGRNENLGLLSATLAESSHPDRFTPSAPAVPPQGTGSVWRWVRAGAGSMEMGTARGNVLGLGSKSRKQRNGVLLLDRTGERKATNSF